ncbi:MAG: MBL fold metallo-hydrolase [Ignavibacteriales bacterium]|nr:MBL fold metallo-hydrolase [Ignavibacteriales bacterium]
MIKIHRFVFNPFAENTYLIWEVNSKQTIIIDPGCSNADEENVLKEFIQEKKLIPKYLINTHCHIDHILGNGFIKDEYGVEFLAGEEDCFLLDLMLKEATKFGLIMKQSPMPEKYLSENLILELQGEVIKFLFTPGHSPGEYCIYFPSGNICITGDVLFKESIGRTDLWGGDSESLMNSIQQKLLVLPENTIIFPGHGDESTIGYEHKYNPYFI